MDDPLVCGDPLAERRFAYARAAAGEGDFATAADVLEQALERAPDWAAAWFALGEARARLGDVDAAAEAFGAALRSDPADAQGAAARLALIGRGDPPSSLPAAYVARLFDQYAPRFEAHLTGALGYRAPALIADALSAAAPGRRFASALDIGCGGGLMGEALRDRVGHLTGVDLSPAMIAKARERGVYDALVVGDATALMRRAAPATFDLIVAADSLALRRRPRSPVRRRRDRADRGRPHRVLGRDRRGRRIEPRRVDAVFPLARLRRGGRRGGGRPLPSSGPLRSAAKREAKQPGKICVFERASRQSLADNLDSVLGLLKIVAANRSLSKTNRAETVALPFRLADRYFSIDYAG